MCTDTRVRKYFLLFGRGQPFKVKRLMASEKIIPESGQNYKNKTKI